MTSELDQIIDITITRETQTVSQAGFGVPLILGESMKLDRRVKYYANITEIGVDFAITDTEYKMASEAFSQEISPSSIGIGKKVVVAAGSAVVAATQIVTTTANFQITGHNLEIGASIVTTGFTPVAYNGTFVITTVVDANNVRCELLTDPSGDATVQGTYSASETWAEAVQNCYNYDADWYGLLITSNVQADIEAVAAKSEVLDKLFFARTSDTDVLDSAITTDVMSTTSSNNYDRTTIMYNTDTSTDFIDAAWSGRLLPTTPGSVNWAYKTLTGVTTDTYTSAQSSSVFGKNGNTYQTIAGVDVTRYGTVASGEYIDIIRGADWLKARIQENIFTLLINNDKISFTDAGIGQIVNAIKEILDIGVANNFIRKTDAGDGDYTITAPALSETTATDRGNRLLDGVSFEAYVAGSINKVKITGRILI